MWLAFPIHGIAFQVTWVDSHSMQSSCFLNNSSCNSYRSTKQNEQYSCKWNKKCMKWYDLMRTLNKKLALLNSVSAVLRIFTNPLRLVETFQVSFFVGDSGRAAFFSGQNSHFSCFFPPTPGSHLTVPSFVPMQLCEWPHNTSDFRKNPSQLLSCCWTTVQENKLLE